MGSNLFYTKAQPFQLQGVHTFIFLILSHPHTILLPNLSAPLRRSVVELGRAGQMAQVIINTTVKTWATHLPLNKTDSNYSTIGLTPQMKTPCMFSPLQILHSLVYSLYRLNTHQGNRARNSLKQLIFELRMYYKRGLFCKTFFIPVILCFH